MPIKFTELIYMHLRKSPVSKIRTALAKCEAAGIDVSAQNLETHSLCGKDPIVLAEALVRAKELGVQTTFIQMAGICMAGIDPMKLLPEATKERSAKFDTFSPTRDDRIVGFTRDQREVSAAITITYTLSLSQAAYGFTLRHIHERVSAAASVYINTSPDLRTLQLRKSAHEAELRALVLEMIEGLKSLAIEYR